MLPSSIQQSRTASWVALREDSARPLELLAREVPAPWQQEGIPLRPEEIGSELLTCKYKSQ